ncbi:MAG: stage III sporulation protein AC [Oscillospiraceae bacterium]|nr:stage III sporulation protein AC [Oscillospiraceae bacterium]
MDIELIFKVAGVGIIVSVLNILLKKAERDEQALMTTLAGLVVVLMLMIDEIGTLFETVRETFGI